MRDGLEDGDGFELEIGMKIEDCQRRYNCRPDTVVYVLRLLADCYEMRSRSYDCLRRNGDYQMELFDLEQITQTKLGEVVKT